MRATNLPKGCWWRWVTGDRDLIASGTACTVRRRDFGYGEWGRVELTTLTKEFFMPRFLERGEAIRREPRAAYAWDGVAEVRPFGAMEKQIVEGVY